MKSSYSLEETIHFFRRIGSAQALTVLYLVDHFEGMYISDLAAVLDTTVPRMVNLCINLERSGIIQKESVTRAGGRIILVRIDRDVKHILSPFLLHLKKDPAVIAAGETYQRLKEAKQLVSDRYGV